MVPSNSGRDVFSPVRGSVHSLVPVASPIKFFTVLGALEGKSSHVRSPAVVWKTAVGGFLAGAACGAAFVLLPAGAVLLGLLWAPAARLKHSRINAARVTIHLSLNVNGLLEMERQQYVKALRRETEESDRAERRASGAQMIKEEETLRR